RNGGDLPLRRAADRAHAPAPRRVVLQHRRVLEGRGRGDLAVHAVHRARLHAHRRRPRRAARSAARDPWRRRAFAGQLRGALQQALAGKVAASCAATTPAELALLNPAVDSAVFRGRGNIPRGYLLRVPPGAAGQFAQRLAQIAADARVVPEARTRPTRVAKRSGTTKGATRTASAKHLKRTAKPTGASRSKARRPSRRHATSRIAGSVPLSNGRAAA